MQNFAGTMLSGIFAFLSIALGVPLALEKVPPNCWYGYRVSRFVMTDEKAWYEVNRGGGRQLIFAGTVFAVAAVISSFFIGNPGAQADFVSAVSLLAPAGAVYTLVWSLRLSKRLAGGREARD
jgi:hypothetical protein